MAWARLAGAGWVLIREGALLPIEYAELYPAPMRLAARVLQAAAVPRGRPGERLARALERLGPVAIKLGQLLSTRADILGAPFADDLARLKDRLDPFPLGVARTEVARALGRPVDEVFTEFGPAVAAASLAQAHRATLADGRAVAVKVLRPGIETRVARDAKALALAAYLAQRLVPASRRLEPEAFAATVIRTTQLELDLRMEAAAADELRQVMATDGQMAAPAVIWEAVARRVMTLEWAQGWPLSDPASLDQPGVDRPALATGLVRGFLSQALDHGLFHADLHEGNLFVAAPARITAVDFGIVGRLGPGERRYLAEILLGFLRKDYVRVAQVHFEAGYVSSDQNVGEFAQALRAVGEQVFGRPADQISMGRVLTQLFEITALFGMRLRPELVLLQKTMVTVEGVARRIDPQHDIWAAADPVVRRWMTRELAPPAQVRRFAEEARSALRTIARLAEAPPSVIVEPAQPKLLYFALGALATLAALVLGLVVG